MSESGQWSIEKRDAECDYVLRYGSSTPLVIVRPRTSMGQTLTQAGPFVMALAAKLYTLAGGVSELSQRSRHVLEALVALDGWLSVDSSGTTQLFIGRTPEGGYEVGFARYGALSQKTSRGATLIDAITKASQDVAEAIDFDAAPPPDPDEWG